MIGYLIQHEGVTYSTEGVVPNVTLKEVETHNADLSAAEVEWIRNTKPETFVGYYSGKEHPGGLGFVNTWVGEKLAAATVVSCWRDRHRNMMFSILATIDGVMYHGRGQGNGMSVVMRRSRKQ